MPLISVVTSAFNCEKTIEGTFRSVIAQTITDFEWIIVDDCSTDGTAKILDDFCHEDNRIKVIHCDANKGAANARNVGIEAAKGRYIAFIDADDVWKPEKLQKQLDYMKEHDCAFTYTNYYLLFPNGTIRLYRPKKLKLNYKQLLKQNNIGCSTVMYDTEKIGKVFMPLDAPKREDHAAWLDILKTGVEAFKINEGLAEYRVGVQSVSSNKFKMLKFQYKLFRDHEGFNPIKAFFCTLRLSLNKVFKKYIY